VRVGLTEEEKIEHALALNLVRRHLSREQRQELVAKLRQRGLSFPRIAELLGVDTKTVYNDLNSILENSKIENPCRIQRSDGKTYPARQRTEAERQALAERAQALRSEGATFPEITEPLAQRGLCSLASEAPNGLWPRARDAAAFVAAASPAGVALIFSLPLISARAD